MRVKRYYYRLDITVDVREADFDGDTAEFRRYDEPAARESLEDHIKGLSKDDFKFIEVDEEFEDPEDTEGTE